MAKGSVRKKGKKWYARFYVEDESGNRVCRRVSGTESKSETEALMRGNGRLRGKEIRSQVRKCYGGNVADQWVEEELKPGNLSNGTVMSYQGTVNRIAAIPIGERKLET